MEKPYFCPLCQRTHRPYYLIYTQHLQFAIDKKNADVIKEAKKLYLDIIDNLEALENPYILDLPKDLAKALAAYFYASNFPVIFHETHIEIHFGKLKILLLMEGLE